MHDVYKHSNVRQSAKQWLSERQDKALNRLSPCITSDCVRRQESLPQQVPLQHTLEAESLAAEGFGTGVRPLRRVERLNVCLQIFFLQQRHRQKGERRKR